MIQTQWYLESQKAYESSAATYCKNLALCIRSTKGSFITDIENRVYIDFLSGAGALPLGHNHPEIVHAIKEQLEVAIHTLDFTTPLRDKFVKKIFSLLPQGMQGHMKVQFCGPTGADAVEAALKLCKTHTGRGAILAFNGSYHGCTHGAMAVSGFRWQKEKIADPMPGVHFFPFSYCHQCPLGLRPAHCNTNCIAYLENVLNDSYGGVTKPAAVIVELVQGEGGVVPATFQFVASLRKMTQLHGIPLIVDEVQSGLGRTGKWFSFEHYDIQPDVVLLSKALGGIGLPISLMLYDRKLDSWKSGAHMGTFRGNQLSMVAGLAAIEIMERDAILDHVVVMGKYIVDQLQKLKEEVDIIDDIRFKGLMIGIELKNFNGIFAEDWAKKIQLELFQDGLIVELGGRANRVIKLLPPLNVEISTVNRAMAILRRSMQKVIGLQLSP